jgi:Ca2+-binding RTX toxin-like protein
MPKAVSLQGSRSDFVIQRLSAPEGGSALLLVGTSGARAGTVLRLDGVEKLVFSDGAVSLADTAFANPQSSLPSEQPMEQQSAHAAAPRVADFYTLQELPADSGQAIAEPGKQSVAKIKAPAAGGYTHVGTAQDQSAIERSDTAKHAKRGAVVPNADSPDPTSRTSSGTARSESGRQSSPADRKGDSSDKSAVDNHSGGVAWGGGSGAGFGADANKAGDSSTQAQPLDYAAKSRYGTPGNDILIGEYGDDVFYTSGGNDSYIGRAGNDTLVGVNPDEASALQLSPGVFLLRAKVLDVSLGSNGFPDYSSLMFDSTAQMSGIEFIRMKENDEAIALARISLPTMLDDELAPLDTADAWRVDALSGNDKITGGQAGDAISGGSGDDYIDGGINDVSGLSEFVETLVGGEGNDQLFFYGAGDLSSTTPPSDSRANVSGDDGNDQLNVTLDSRVMLSVSGGAGIDVLRIQQLSASGPVWDPNVLRWSYALDGAGQLRLSATYLNPLVAGAGLFESDAAIEKIGSGFGTASLMNLVRPTTNFGSISGSEGDDLIVPIDGVASLIEAGAGDDIVIAGAGSRVSLGSGVNQLYSESGNITLDYASAAAGVRLNLANKLGLVFDDQGEILSIDRLYGVPLGVIGSNFDDALSGTTSNENLTGGAGHDRLSGGGGNDQLSGGVGDDTLITHGDGQSVLSGGTGADKFFVDIDFAASAGATITDFSSAELDQIFIDMTTYSGTAGDYFGRYTIVDEQNTFLTSKNTSHESENIMEFILKESQRGYYLVNNETGQSGYVFVEADQTELTAAQLAALINVDYF